MSAPPSVAEAALVLASILGAILKMSDDVRDASSPLDAQGKLLKMQNSIQKNGARVVPYVKVVMDLVQVAGRVP